MIINEANKLPVIKIWGEVNNFLRANRKVLIKSLFVLFTIQIVLETYLNYQWLKNPHPGAEAYSVALISFLISILIAVTVHRLILKGQTSISEFGNLRWTFTETRYVLYILAILASTGLFGFLILMFLLSFHPSHTVFQGLEVGLFGIGVYIICRLCVIFPAIAVNDNLSIASAWKLTAGNAFRLVLLVALIPIAYGIFTSWFEAAIGPALDPVAYAGLNAFTSDLITIYSIMTLSVVYKHLKGGQFVQY